MNPWLQDVDMSLYHGDALTVLRTLPAESVDCCVTSPPYWGLRDYGTGSWDGGDPGCDHSKVADPVAAVSSSTLGGGKKTTGHLQEGYGQVCGKCGARRADNQLGLEPTPQEYVAALVAVFEEVRRVLKPSGTCWVNLGDSYASGDRDGHGTRIGGEQGTNRASAAGLDTRRPPHPAGLKPKDLVGTPWRVAFALQDAGWYLRSDIIWAKPNPMPESVTDRPTKAHEYVFLLSKQPRYFFDQEAVREQLDHPNRSGTNPSLAVHTQPGNTYQIREGERNGIDSNPAGRNVRSVWTIATQPYSQAHFATYPVALAERCILAGCPQGGTVLDPFAGAGTTAVAARKHGRRSILIELNEDYCKLIADRLAQQSLLAEAVA